MFIILFLLCLYGNREYPGSFQNKVLSSKLFFHVTAKVKWKGGSFWSGQALSAKLSLTSRGNVNYYKSVHYPIGILPVEKGTKWQFSKQISNFSFQLSFQRYFLLAQTEGKKRPFLEECKEGHLVDIRDEKVSPFVKFEIILPHHCFLLYLIANKCWRTWNSMINLWIDSRICQK